MSYLYQSEPLPWEVYELLMRRMDTFIDDASDHTKIKYAGYQTVIAVGCHFGPKAKELLTMRWSDLLQVGTYLFRQEAQRSPLVIEGDLRAIVNRNHRIVKPSYAQQYILQGSSANDKPLISRHFNTALSRMFEQFDIKVEAPSVMTLRKTFALKIWAEYGKSDEGLAVLSKEFALPKHSVRQMLK